VAAVTVIAGAAFFLAACGSQGSPEAEVTKSVRNWTAALSGGDGRAACDLMTTAGRVELARFAVSFARTATDASCQTNVKRFHARLTPQVQRQTLDADVDAVQVDGDTATVRMANGGPTELRLRLQDGTWRVDQAFRHGWRLVGAPSYALGVR
jgi:hypothetical protein